VKESVLESSWGAVRHLGSKDEAGGPKPDKAQIKEHLVSSTSTGEVWSVYRYYRM
jgi:hypothetical protein